MPEAGDETHSHTHGGTSPNLRRTVFDASEVRGPLNIQTLETTSGTSSRSGVDWNSLTAFMKYSKAADIL